MTFAFVSSPRQSPDLWTFAPSFVTQLRVTLSYQTHSESYSTTQLWAQLLICSVVTRWTWQRNPIKHIPHPLHTYIIHLFMVQTCRQTLTKTMLHQTPNQLLLSQLIVSNIPSRSCMSWCDFFLSLHMWHGHLPSLPYKFQAISGSTGYHKTSLIWGGSHSCKHTP